MAYVLTEINNETLAKVKSFQCDTLADLPKLPTSKTLGTGALYGDNLSNCMCGMGSSALVLEDRSVWCLNSSDIWVKITK